jgi:pimeloyl-ACP methyl ester carboxylesterase
MSNSLLSTNSAYFAKEAGVRLYYEISGSGAIHVVMLTGFAATCRLFDETVAFLTKSNCSVLTFDYRGAGKSVVEEGQQSSGDRQTSRLLAADTLALLQHVQWIPPPSSSSSSNDSTPLHDGVHVYGASMGGMIAQELALLLLDQQQLASLYLAVTCSTRYAIRLPFGSRFWTLLLWPLTSSLFTRQKLVDELLIAGYSSTYLDKIASSSSSSDSDQTNRQILHERFTNTWDTHMSWNLPTITAQSCVVATHHIPPESLRRLRESGIRITVHIATEDKSMPTPLQRELAVSLQANVIEFEGGHLECQADMPRFHALLLEHLTSSTTTTTTTWTTTTTPIGCCY